MSLLNPYVWLAIALACLLSFFGGCQRGTNKVQGAFDAHIAADDAATKTFNAESKAKDAAQAEAIAQIGFRYEREKADALEAQDRVIADLRSGAKRVRPQWRCPTAPVSDTAAGPEIGDGDSDLREADIGHLVGIGAAADAQVRACQAVIRAYQQG